LGQETALETTLKRNFMPLSLCQGLMFGPNDHADMKLIQKAICCRMRGKKKNMILVWKSLSVPMIAIG
jgi:hypothetical protein